LERRIYISDEIVALCEYVRPQDDKYMFDCWHDPDTVKGYNFHMDMPLDQFCVRKIRNRFMSTIVRLEDMREIGQIFLSPDTSPPDLAIMLYSGFRGMGYGTRAFRLGLKYCFAAFDLEEIFAGCYEGNAASARMLAKLGFERSPGGDRIEENICTGGTIIQHDYVLKRR